MYGVCELRMQSILYKVKFSSFVLVAKKQQQSHPLCPQIALSEHYRIYRIYRLKVNNYEIYSIYTVKLNHCVCTLAT